MRYLCNYAVHHNLILFTRMHDNTHDYTSKYVRRIRMTTKPTTIRIESELLNQIDQKCNSLKCSRNDYIKNAIEFAMNGYSDFNFDESDSESITQNIEPTETPKIIVRRID